MQNLKKAALDSIQQAANLNALDAVRVQFLGKAGEVTGLLKQVGALPPEERKNFGEQVNKLRDELTAVLTEKQKILEMDAINEKLASETIDISLPPAARALGTIHPITQTIDDITAIFAAMGFTVATGPDIEDDFHNFTALNFPPEHPARSMHDTFFVEGGAPSSSEAVGQQNMHLLRTHTSTVQVRHMTTQKPPIKIIVPGRVYRSDWDATHVPMFHQVEGLIIDEIGKVTMGHLRGCLDDFVRAIFNVPHLTTRFRPHYFPFTEPSAELDIAYTRRDGKVIIGEKDKFMEVLGCGMVHPNVLRNCGINPEKYQGFAFGMGVERIAMLKYGLPDLRDMFDSDLRWLKHYGFSILEQPNRATGN
jgi:phenylalanyl-tRNA synthetase alpha chain